MRKLFAAVVISSLLAGSMVCGSLYAEEVSSESLSESSEQTAAESTGTGNVQSEALAGGQEILSIPLERPEYKALDYVKISDNEYKRISISVYPPVDSSAEAQAEYQTTVDTMIMSHLFSLYPIEEIPEDLLNYTAGSLSETYQQYAKMYGMDFDTFLQTYLQKDATTFESQVKKAAEQTLKEEILLKAVAEKENITITDEEYEKGCEEYAVRYGYESADALKQAFDESTIRVSLLMDKTFEYLESVTTITQIIETETETENLTEAEGTVQTPAAAQEPTADAPAQTPASDAATQTPASDAAAQTPASDAAAQEPAADAAAQTPASDAATQTPTSETAAS